MLILNQTDILMLGAIAGSFSVGIYGAAVKTSGWVTFVLMSVNAISAPTFAALYAEDNHRDLQILVSTAARWMFFPSLAIAVGLVVFSHQVLGLFGEEFLAAKGAMLVLILGQLVNVGAGSVGYLMQMTGHQNQCAMVFGSCAGINVVLNIMFIPTMGVLGAAIATAFTRSLWNIWLHQLVVKHIGVQPSIVSALLR
jgi:O-antigen/teichoic acid export membrane protein